MGTSCGPFTPSFAATSFSFVPNGNAPLEQMPTGWRLEGRRVGNLTWVSVYNRTPGGPADEPVVIAPVPTGIAWFRFRVTEVLGDSAEHCGISREQVIAAAAAATVGTACCCAICFWLGIGSATLSLCGCGVALALRHGPRTPMTDSPWMGDEEAVRQQVQATYEQLEREWHQSSDDVVSEAAASFKTPDSASAPDVLARLRENAFAATEGAAADPRLASLPLAALELLRRYTFEGADVDRMVGYQDAPPSFNSFRDTDPQHPVQATTVWQSYSKQCQSKLGLPSRNQPLYQRLNRAMRDAAEQKEGADAEEVWQAVRPLLKQGAMLMAAAAAGSPPERKGITSRLSGKHRWARLMTLPPEVAASFAALQPGSHLAWSVAVASASVGSKGISDFLCSRGSGQRHVLVRMTAPVEAARALGLGSISLYGEEGEIILPMGTMFRVRKVTTGRVLTRFVRSSADHPLTWADLRRAFLHEPLIVVDAEWASSPAQWCAAATRLFQLASEDASGASGRLGGECAEPPAHLVPLISTINPLSKCDTPDTASLLGGGGVTPSTPPRVRSRTTDASLLTPLVGSRTEFIGKQKTLPVHL
eukprot:TRINITY_DN4592_c0_g1_i2.p1 TRINITY_DN4592_c0_g1~~TRINITY_DN4592_c0_g1_i2.p1  ORF type:complete len:591 (+),score=140.12 TRINITY_DN4592_c0_g1_i2:563-2335(+)